MEKSKTTPKTTKPGTASAKPPATTSSALRDKLKRRTKVMQQLRTNTCSEKTVDQLADLDPNLQMQVVQQMRRQPKTKTTTKRPTKSTKSDDGTVSQSTDQTMQSIQATRQRILITAVEKQMQNLMALADQTDPTDPNSLQALQ